MLYFDYMTDMVFFHQFLCVDIFIFFCQCICHKGIPCAGVFASKNHGRWRNHVLNNLMKYFYSNTINYSQLLLTATSKNVPNNIFKIKKSIHFELRENDVNISRTCTFNDVIYTTQEKRIVNVTNKETELQKSLVGQCYLTAQIARYMSFFRKYVTSE